MECCICAEVKPFVVATLCSRPLHPHGHEPVCCEECMAELCARQSDRPQCPLCRTPLSHCFVYSVEAWDTVKNVDGGVMHAVQWARHWYVPPSPPQPLSWGHPSLMTEEDLLASDSEEHAVDEAFPPPSDQHSDLMQRMVAHHQCALDSFHTAYAWSLAKQQARLANMRLCNFVLQDFVRFPQLVDTLSFSCLSCRMPVGLHERADPSLDSSYQSVHTQ